jgi:recombination protein RecR
LAERVAGPEIQRLIQLLARLPGLGPRSARRAALHLIRKKDELLGPLADAMQVARERIITCTSCGNVDTIDPCTICCDENVPAHNGSYRTVSFISAPGPKTPVN